MHVAGEKMFVDDAGKQPTLVDPATGIVTEVELFVAVLGASTVREHMPSAHRAHAEWTPSRLLAWAEKIGPATRQLCAPILAERPHPEQGFRSCLGLLRLGQRCGQERLEAACERAGRVRARSYRHIESILKHGLDRVPLAHDDGAPVAAQPIDHENIRGRGVREGSLQPDFRSGRARARWYDQTAML
ncbi:hypothetical protein BE04_31085 [Sorangium cellulosum]|uniref:Transposase n=1 Tax=Sorangium cellulosum TaxID=56 RepID=A0A150PUC3_SORCE|nr:hypothetical protein BE04_31085 [Sorangium cellulosum]